MRHCSARRSRTGTYLSDSAGDRARVRAGDRRFRDDRVICGCGSRLPSPVVGAGASGRRRRAVTHLADTESRHRGRYEEGRGARPRRQWRIFAGHCQMMPLLPSMPAISPAGCSAFCGSAAPAGCSVLSAAPWATACRRRSPRGTLSRTVLACVGDGSFGMTGLGAGDGDPARRRADRAAVQQWHVRHHSCTRRAYPGRGGRPPQSRTAALAARPGSHGEQVGAEQVRPGSEHVANAGRAALMKPVTSIRR